MAKAIRPGSIRISDIRVEQFNKMCEMLRSIRTWDVKKEVAMYKRLGISKEVAYLRIIEKIQGVARESRGISELKHAAATKEVTHG